MLRAARTLTLLALSFVAATPVLANNFHYNTMDIRIGTSPSTFGGTFNMQFLENAHVVARIDSELEGDYDLAAGVGFNGPFGQFVDMTGQILFHNVKDEDSSSVIGDEFMTEYNLGARVWLMERTEIHGKLGQVIDGDDNHAVWEIGTRFHSSQQLALGASILSNGIYGNQFMIISRFHF